MTSSQTRCTTLHSVPYASHLNITAAIKRTPTMVMM